MEQIIQTYDEEAAVLACVLLEPELVDEVAAKIRVDDFHDFRHQNLYKLMIDMVSDQMPIDIRSIRGEAINKLGSIEKVGGVAYLSSLPQIVASSSHLPYAVGCLERKSKLRRLENCAGEILHCLRTKETDDDDKLESCGLSLTAALDEGGGGGLGIRDIAKQAMLQIESAFSHKGTCTGIPTGFPALDSKTTGFHGGELIILAARPGMGKTSLAMGIAEHLAVDGDTPVGVLSLEMASTALILRTFSGRTGIDSRDLRGGSLTKSDFVGLNKALTDIANSKLVLDDSHGINLVEMSARIRRMVRKHKCKLIIVDYLQLVHAKAESRVQEVSKISNALKVLAVQLDIPILCLSQLNRGVESGEGRPPRLSDLRESGSIEQDADQVHFLYKDDPYDELTRLIVAKNRSGPTGEVELQFEPKFTRYVTPKPQPEVYISRPVHPDFEPVNA